MATLKELAASHGAETGLNIGGEVNATVQATSDSKQSEEGENDSFYSSRAVNLKFLWNSFILVCISLYDTVFGTRPFCHWLLVNISEENESSLRCNCNFKQLLC